MKINVYVENVIEATFLILLIMQNRTAKVVFVLL